jgi:hypothetical protein
MQDCDQVSMSYFRKFFFAFMPVLTTGMIFISCNQEKNLSPEEGLKAIKVLNSDLINLSDGISGNLAFGGLKYLMEEPTSPLSTQNGLAGKWLNDSITSLVPFTGKYTWNENKFERISGSDIIDINFQIPGTTENSANFTVTGFECRRMLSSLCFPMEIKASMLNHDEEILVISGNSAFMDDLPGKIDFTVRGEEFEGAVIAERTRQDDRGTLDIEMEFRVRGVDIIKGSIHAQIGYSGKQVFFRTYEPDVRVFDVKIAGKLDYSKVDPTSKDYVKSFNDNCHIGFYDSGSDKKIGDFGIGALENGELLGWVLFLSDGKPLFLEEQLLIVEKLLNYKLPNKVSP